VELINWKDKLSVGFATLGQLMLSLLINLGKKMTSSPYALCAFLITCLFYFPAFKHGAVDAGLLYTGDILGYYLPAIIKTHSLLAAHNFTAIDYSLFNGSSDFFLSPNFFALHPGVVIYSLLIPFETATLHSTGLFLTFLLAVHSFLACYFSLKLFTRFFFFEFGLALLIATGFSFSGYMINALTQPPFLFCASIVPWATYSVLRYVEMPTWRLLLLASLPIVLGLLGGYLPMGIASLALSGVLAAAKLTFIGDNSKMWSERAAGVLLALVPFLVALLVVSPYLYAVYTFHAETSSASVPGLFYSAHQLAELPQGLLRVFSTHLSIPGPIYEFWLSWGVIAITIAAIFFLSMKVINVLTAFEWKLFKVAAIIYFVTVLAIFGEYSVVSDMVFYLVPQVGKMHIYQRFLLPGHLLFMVLLALMLKAVVDVRPPVAMRIALVILAVITVGVAITVAGSGTWIYGINPNNYLVFELILGCLFVCSLFVPGKNFVYIATIVLCMLPSLDQMHDLSHGGNAFEIQRKRIPIPLDSDEQTRLLSYLKRFSDKQVIKYVDVTPMWTKSGVETFPKDYPYFLLPGELRLSSYGGFTFYLSARADYMQHMPVEGDVAVRPDWEYLDSTGADFVVARDMDTFTGALGELRRKTKPEDIYHLRNEAVILPLRSTEAIQNYSAMPTLFDNGYIRVIQAGSTTEAVDNLALRKTARQSSDGGGGAQLAVDGVTDGDFGSGSVSHTGQGSNAWLDVDLGAIQTFDAIRIWNRTDCCGERLHDYSIFVSEDPFLPTDTVSLLRQRARTREYVGTPPNPMITVKTGRVQGRHVRVQLFNNKLNEENFLSLAEIEVLRYANVSRFSNNAGLKISEFMSNHANYLRFRFQATEATGVQYLFWNNPRISYYLNGKKTQLVERNGLHVIEVPVGQNTIEIRYRHWPLRIFWLFYTMFALILLCAVLPVRFVESIISKFRILGKRIEQRRRI